MPYDLHVLQLEAESTGVHWSYSYLEEQKISPSSSGWMSNRAMVDSGDVGEAAYQPASKLLREVVLDFLLHSSYVDTARAFAKESVVTTRLESGDAADIHSHAHKAGMRLDGDAATTADDEDTCMAVGDDGDYDREKDMEYIPKAEQEIVRLRGDIRSKILAGEVDEATHLLNTYFPAVLYQDGDIISPSPLPSAYSSSSTNDAALPLQARVNYTSQTSTNPVHIALNLRIQAFVETARVYPLPNPDNTKFVFDEKYHKRQVELLHRAQRLYAEVEALQDKEIKMIYRSELKAVGGLLAYPIPEKSPMKYYFDQSRREAVAEQVNSAILSRLAKPTISNLELIARQTSTVWSVLHDNQHKMPPPGLWPPGVALPSPPSVRRASSTRASSKPEKEADIVPLFELKDLLDQ